MSKHPKNKHGRPDAQISRVQIKGVISTEHIILGKLHMLGELFASIGVNLREKREVLHMHRGEGQGLTLQ